MSSKKKTKVTPVKLTPKQASIASVSLLRGLDNAIEKSRRGTAELETLKSKVGSLSAGLSNLASAPAPKAPAAKPAPKAPAAKPVKAAKPATKAPAPKPIKPAKPVVPAKAAKAAPAKPAPKAEAKPYPAQPDDPFQKEPVAGRPAVRAATKEILAANGGRMLSLDLRKAVCEKYGRYSNQTFYELFKKDPELKLEANHVSLVTVVKADKDMELVQRVERDRATASVV